MSDPEVEESLDFWNRVADDWQIQVGHDGDRNRILNSDPVLWKFSYWSLKSPGLQKTNTISSRPKRGSRIG